MLRHATLAVAAMCLLYWLSKVMTTPSVFVGLILPAIGVVLAFVWAFWTVSERISERAKPQSLDLESLELMKQALREKRSREQTGSAMPVARAGNQTQSPVRSTREPPLHG